MAALRVLVVEDDTNVGALLAETLEAIGHEVCAIATTEADAVSAALRLRPDLMIVDVWLGDGNGVSAVAAIERSISIPHFFITDDYRRVQTFEPGAVVIRKPVSQADLAGAITLALDIAAMATERISAGRRVRNG